MTRRLSPFCLVLAIGCGAAHDPSDGGSEPDARVAPPDSASPECVPGSSRVVPCGNCGTGNDVCTPEGRWSMVGGCVGAGICAAGTVETETSDRCGVRTRTCNPACAWEDWEQTTPEGECVPGETSTESCGPSDARELTCTEACEWAASECVSLCPGTRRTEPPDAEEICIPAGPFIRGSEEFLDARPVREVYVSAYFISRFPTTNDRYRACVAAGACTPPESSLGLPSFNDPSMGRFPVQAVSRSQAARFCEWDGDRRLPSEAQWEKAARGPAPRDQAYPWGAEFDCELVNCSAERILLVGTAVDARPELRSYFGVDMLVGGGYEWTYDSYQPDYYQLDESLSDPTGPSEMFMWYTQRGRPSGASDSSAYHLARRVNRYASDPPGFSAFRCARIATEERE